MARDDGKIQLMGFGGLMRYDEEYQSKFMLSPAQVVGFLVIVAVFVLALRIFWPITL